MLLDLRLSLLEIFVRIGGSMGVLEWRVEGGVGLRVGALRVVVHYNWELQKVVRDILYSVIEK